MRYSIKSQPPVKRQKAFTLIELMIAMAIVALLAAIAYPSYRRTVLKSHRSDAKIALTDTAQSLEQCYSAYGGYDMPTCPIQNNTTFMSPEGFYKISVNVPDQTSFTLTAKAQGSQTDDSTCETYTLNQAGHQKAEDANNTDTTSTCW